MFLICFRLRSRSPEREVVARVLIPDTTELPVVVALPVTSRVPAAVILLVEIFCPMVVVFEEE